MFNLAQVQLYKTRCQTLIVFYVNQEHCRLIFVNPRLKGLNSSADFKPRSLGFVV